MSVRVAVRHGVPIASAGTSVPWLARLPFPVRTIIWRWRRLIAMVVGVGIALGLGMTMLGMNRGHMELL